MSDQRSEWKTRAAECLKTSDSAVAAAEAADTEELRVHFLRLAQEALKLAHEIEAVLEKL